MKWSISYINRENTLCCSFNKTKMFVCLLFVCLIVCLFLFVCFYVCLFVFVLVFLCLFVFKPHRVAGVSKKKKILGESLINLRRAPSGFRYATETLTKFWIFSKFDGISEPPRGIRIVERGDPYQLEKNP